MSRPCAVGALAMSAVLFISPSTQAQQTYLIHDLGEVADSGAGARSFTFWQLGMGNTMIRMPFRINNKNQVAFYRRDAGDYTPWLWLPEDDAGIGLDAGFYNLTEEDGSDDNGLAFDINESTQIAGSRGDIGDEEAIVWTISSGSVAGTLIDFSSSPFEDDRTSRAHGLNDDSPPVVVGCATYAEMSICGNPVVPVYLPAPFIATLGSTPDDLPLTASNVQGWGLSVNADSNPLSVGFVKDSCAGAPAHDADTTALQWEDDTHEENVPKLDSSFGTDAIKINEAGNIVGWSREEDPSDAQNSLATACFWVDGATAPDELGNFTAHTSTEETVAYGMNETSPLTVAGTSITAQSARIWMQDGNGDWDDDDTDLVIDLNTVLLADCASAWALVEAFDVSDDGWIVGWGIADGSVRGFVLEPDGVTCVADISSAAASGYYCPDGVVNLFDQLLLIDNWGTDGPGADISDQGGGADEVDLFDLLAMHEMWGECGEESLGPGMTYEELLELLEGYGIEIEE